MRSEEVPVSEVLGVQTRPSPTRGRSGRTAMAAHAAAAVVLGVLCDIGLHLPESAALLFVAGFPWVLLSVSAGRSVGRPLRGSAAGAAVLVLGLVGYYVWMLLGQGVSIGTLGGSGYQGGAWLVLGVVVGGIAGLVGGLTRSGSPLVAALAWSGVVAVPCADGLLHLALPDHVLASVVLFGLATSATVVWARRSGTSWPHLVVGSVLATAVLWQVELAILQRVLGRFSDF